MRNSIREHPREQKRRSFKKAEEGINIAIHWQDADSSSNAMTERFPDAEIMISGGHAGKAHKKQLQELAKSNISLIRIIMN